MQTLAHGRSPVRSHQEMDILGTGVNKVVAEAVTSVLVIDPHYV